MNNLEKYGKTYLKYRIRFTHWRTGEELEEIGIMPPQYNNPNSDRIVVVTDKYITDILKNTIISKELIDDL